MFKVTVNANEISILLSLTNSSVSLNNDFKIVKGTESDANFNYMRYLGKFLKEFKKYVSLEKYKEIIDDLSENSKGWRHLNREVRKACDMMKLMPHKQFQDTWMYESNMYLRSTYGKDAPWITEEEYNSNNKSMNKKVTTSSSKQEVKAIKTIDKANIEPVKVKSSKIKGYDLNEPWDILNKAIADRVAEPASKD